MAIADNNPLMTLIAQIAASNGRNSAFDPVLAAVIQSAEGGVSNLNRQFLSGTNNAKVSYDENLHGLQEQKVQGYTNNEGSFAGNGLLHSGIFATEQGKVGEAFQNGITAAAQRRQEAIQALSEARLNGFNTIQGQLTTAQGDAAQRAQQAAQAQAAQQMQAQQNAALLAIQQQGLSNQQTLAQQQLGLYQQQISPSGSSSRPSRSASQIFATPQWKQFYQGIVARRTGIPASGPAPQPIPIGNASHPIPLGN